MGFNEADTRAKLIDPALHKIGWTEDLMRREMTAGTIEIISGNPKRRKGRADYLLCLPVKEKQNPLSICPLEAKKPGWNRILESLATGSGKTRIAVQLLDKLVESGQVRKALFVCDRNELRKQGFGQMFSVFGEPVYEKIFF